MPPSFGMSRSSLNPSGSPPSNPRRFILPEIFRGSAAGAGAAPPSARLFRRDAAHVLPRGGHERLHDVVIAGAAADIALEIVADLRLGGRRVFFQQRRRRHHHTRRAEPALQPVMILECLLYGVHRAIGCAQPLDGRHLRALGLGGEDGTRFHSLAVHVHHARPALAGVTAHMRAREAEAVSDEIHKQRATLDLAFRRLAVHGHADLWHWHLPVALFVASLSEPSVRSAKLKRYLSMAVAHRRSAARAAARLWPGGDFLEQPA